MNLPQTLTVEVTEQDIKQGNPGKEKSCAIALAMRRAVGSKRITVDMSARVRDDADHTVATYGLTDRAFRFMKRFDKGEPVSPTRFRFRRYA